KSRDLVSATIVPDISKVAPYDRAVTGGPMRSRTAKLLAPALPLAVITTLAAGTVPPAAAAPPPAIVVEDGATQPVFSRADAIVETVFVEVAGVDSDADGAPDRVAVDIMRPRETERGLKVPVILEASPYYAGGNDDVAFHDVDIDGEDARAMPTTARDKLKMLREAGVTVDAAEPFDGYYDNYFVPRGYAGALVESLGTGRSTGWCPRSEEHTSELQSRENLV